MIPVVANMRHSYLILGMVLLSLIAEPAAAASREVQSLTWEQFRSEVANRRLNGRRVDVRLLSGKTVKSTLRRVEADSILVELNPNIGEQYRTATAEASIPRAEVSSIRFGGRQGKHGLIGGLVGLGASGAIIGGAAAATPSGEGHGMEGIFVLVPVMALGGYFIGRHYDKVIPEFHIIP